MITQLVSSAYSIIIFNDFFFIMNDVIIDVRDAYVKEFYFHSFLYYFA